MNFELFKKNKYPIGVAVIIIALAVYKFPFLSLPYYWDEAWPYSVAVHAMYNHGLSLIPGAVAPFVARGHTLMYFFLGAAWMKIFGTSLFSGHCFALFISISIYWSYYFVTFTVSKRFNHQYG